jgi:hypothetical protein
VRIRTRNPEFELIDATLEKNTELYDILRSNA